MSRQFSNLLGKLNGFTARHAFATATFIGLTKTVGCDFLVQKYLDNKIEIDWKRTQVFFLFGSLYVGGFQYVLFSKFIPRIWPMNGSLRNILSASAFDNFVHIPFLYLPLFYTIREAVNTYSEGTGPKSWAQGALSKYGQNFWPDNMVGWKLYIPAHFVTFGLLPVHLRVPWVCSVGCIYICTISFLRGNFETKPDVASKELQIEY